MKYAVIDIGSNSVRLMLWADGKTLYKKVITTRLGENIACGALSEAAMERTVCAIRAFAEEGARENARVLAFATAAVRAAGNGAEFVRRVKCGCGLDVDVVSGEREAMLGICGALGMGDGGIVDIGGASTEICFRRGGEVVARTSLSIGCVRLLDCKDREEMLSDRIGSALSQLSMAAVPPVYAIGGTAYLMACLRRGKGGYDEALEHTALEASWLRSTAKTLLAMPVSERKALAGMDAERADISAAGAMLLSEILKRLDLAEIYFSCGDNLEGYLWESGIV